MCRSPEWRHDTPEGYNITKIQFFRWQNSQNFKRILKMLSKYSQSSQKLVPGGYSLKPQPKNRIFQMPKQFKNTLFPFFRQKHAKGAWLLEFLWEFGRVFCDCFSLFFLFFTLLLCPNPSSPQAWARGLFLDLGWEMRFLWISRGIREGNEFLS